MNALYDGTPCLSDEEVVSIMEKRFKPGPLQECAILEALTLNRSKRDYNESLDRIIIAAALSVQPVNQTQNA